MIPISTLRRALLASAPLLALACADAPLAPRGDAPTLATTAPVAHWMKVVGLPAANALTTAGDGTLWAAAAEQGVLRSTDGFRWSGTAPIPGAPEVAAIAVGSDGTAWIGTAAGVLRSPDGGRSWISSGLGDLYVSHVALDDRGRVFALATGGSGGLFRSDDGGLHWSRIFAPINPRESIYEFLTVYRGDVFLGPYSQTPYPGFESGTIWEPLSGMWELPNFFAVASDMIVTASGTVLVAYSGGVGRSGDGGRTWKAAYDGYPAFDLVDGGRAGLFALVNEGRVLRSTDDGVTWPPSPPPRRCAASRPPRSRQTGGSW